MALTQEQFESLVTRLEQESARDPKLYKLKLACFAMLGYVYVAGVLALLLTLVAAMVIMATRGAGWLLLVKKIGLLLVGLILVVARSMWVKFDPPSGRRIVSSEAPRLFEMIEQIRSKARAPAVHSVLVTQDFNAAVVQQPRLGIFGWPKNYLVLGLPLMQALSLDEFKAVVAHELGHLSGAHGKFGAWIYRVRQGWARLTHALSEQEHWGSFLFVPFFRWFSPAFSAYSFVQARQQEYEADRVSAEVAGPKSAAAALVRVNTHGDFLSNRYWNDVFRRAETEAHPLATPYSAMSTAFSQGCQNSELENSLRSALAARTGYADTHPCLADRLRALSVEPAKPTAIDSNAAEVLLGTTASNLAGEFDRDWQDSVGEWWAQRHDYIKESKQQLERYDALDEITLEEEWQRARLTEEFRNTEDAFMLYQNLLEREPRHLSALFSIGRLLLAKDDEKGIEYLRQVCEHDASATQAACELIVAFLRRNGRDSETRPYIDQYIQASEIEESAHKERNLIRTTDTFLPHDLNKEAVDALARQLEKYAITRARLVRKAVKHRPQQPLYVLGIEQRDGFWDVTGKAKPEELTSMIADEVEFPGETMVLVVEGDNKEFRGKFKNVMDSLVLDKR